MIISDKQFFDFYKAYFDNYHHISLQNRKNFYICAQIYKGQ